MSSFFFLQIPPPKPKLSFREGFFYNVVLLKTGNAWDCVFLHIVNNFFAMFIRSDRAPDLGDPVMIFMFRGSIFVYTSLSLVCINAMYAGNRKRIAPKEIDEGHHGSEDNKALSFNPVLIGILLGISIFLWHQAVKEA